MIIKDDPERLLKGAQKALLINPPIYDTQYWPHWSQPHGLLKVATWLRKQGYTDLRLLDCLATDKSRKVAFRRRGYVNRDNIRRRTVRYRDPEDVAEEIAQKQRDYGIREIAFYEDNLLFNREDFIARLEAIERRGLKLLIYAPEGIEPRLIERDLLTRMRRAGVNDV